MPASPPQNDRVVVGVIDAGGGTIDSVLAGPAAGAIRERLTFTVTTYGSSCVRPAGAQVIAQGIQMTVIPYDEESGEPCTDYRIAYPREVTLTFDRAGEGVIRVQGRSYYAKGLVTIAQPVTINP
jgi:hypothetical protein